MDVQPLQDAIGDTLQRVDAKQHVFEQARTLLSLWLEFASLEPVHVFTANDGSVRFERIGREAGFYIEEAGRVEVVDVSTVAPFSGVVGRTLTGVSGVTLENEAEPSAARLDFEGIETPLFIVNWGDDLHVATELPNHLRSKRPT